MRFFKHSTDAHRGRSMLALLDELGHTGPCCYWFLVEMCAEKLEKTDIQMPDPEQCRFVFHERILRQNLRISRANLRKFLDVCQTNSLLWWEICPLNPGHSSDIGGTLIQILMPKLLDSLNVGLKKTKKNALDIDKDIDVDRDKEEKKEKEKEEIQLTLTPCNPGRPKRQQTPAQQAVASEANRACWDAYRESYFEKYSVEPTRNSTVNSQIANFVKRVGGEDAPEIVRFYLKHNDAKYLKNTHSFGFCLMDAETLRTQWMKNQPITSLDVRRFEKKVEQSSVRISQADVDEINRRIAAENAKKNGLVEWDR